MPPQMKREIEKVQEWKRTTMPYAGPSRASMIQTHQVHYYDELLVEMGARRHRKQGCFSGLKEIFDPYRPRDYKSIVTGEFKERPAECAEPGVQQSGGCFAFLSRSPMHFSWTMPSCFPTDFFSFSPNPHAGNSLAALTSLE